MLLTRVRLGLVVAIVLGACSPAHADRTTDAQAILERHCVRCHSGPKARGDFDYIADTSRLVATGLIVPGDAGRSYVIERIVDGEMPPATVKVRPTAAEVATLQAWVNAMSTARTFRREDDVARALAADAARLAPGDLPYARWFTLGHLANAGVPEAHLERYRGALAETLASLTWAPAPRPPVTVDGERTIMRIDLRELGWTSATWDAIRAAYPYGVARGADVPDAIRADWFVATATRGALYHAILELPDSEAGLARRVGIDMAADIAAGRVARAGFTSSGVSVNNRVIERHATPYGAL